MDNQSTIRIQPPSVIIQVIAVMKNTFVRKCLGIGVLLFTVGLSVMAQTVQTEKSRETEPPIAIPEPESQPVTDPAASAEINPVSTETETTDQTAVDSEEVSASPVIPVEGVIAPTELIPLEANAGPTNTENPDGDEPIDPTLQPALQILGEDVAPGEAQIVNWDFESTFVDISAPVPVLVVNGLKVGPTLCITAAVHGDELNGIEIVRRVVHKLKPEKLTGAVIGVPIVNLQGFKRANRYLPDRRDLNRYFPGSINGSYASRVAYSFFNSVVKKCDYLVDVHTGSLSRTNLPQIRANLMDSDVASLAEKMGSIVVLQSRGGHGTLRRAASDAGIPAVTLETGAPNNLQKEAVEQGVATISNALDALGLTAKSFWKRNAEPVFYRSKWIRARRGGILFSKVELGDNVEKDSVLGLLSNPITNKTTQIKSPIAGRVIGMALNQVMYPGFAAYHIGLKSSVVEAAQPEDIMPDEPMLEVPIDNALNESGYSEDTTVGDLEPIQQEDPSDNTDDKPEINAIEEMELPTVENEE
jgi:predicted deacylase